MRKKLLDKGLASFETKRIQPNRIAVLLRGWEQAQSAAQVAEERFQAALKRAGEGAQVTLDGAPYQVCFWRGKWRLKCLVSRAVRERLKGVNS